MPSSGNIQLGRMKLSRFPEFQGHIPTSPRVRQRGSRARRPCHGREAQAQAGRPWYDGRGRDMFAKQITIDAELRLVETRHCEDVFAMVEKNRAHLRRWMPWVDGSKTVEDVRKWQATAAEQFAKNN